MNYQYFGELVVFIKRIDHHKLRDIFLTLLPVLPVSAADAPTPCIEFFLLPRLSEKKLLPCERDNFWGTDSSGSRQTECLVIAIGFLTTSLKTDR